MAYSAEMSTEAVAKMIRNHLETNLSAEIEKEVRAAFEPHIEKVVEDYTKSVVLTAVNAYVRIDPVALRQEIMFHFNFGE